ncbi:MAG: phosphoribosylformylglycinamidine synthase, partial [Opitutaceae bacterium]|nr:phosphoribosylformylglycinamidine synthase [Opitutaceae bacterium]
MLLHHGSAALSPFRLEKLRRDLAAAGIPAETVSARFLHAIALKDGADALPPAETEILNKLLAYGPMEKAEGEKPKHETPAAPSVVNRKSKIVHFLVAPRPGTISPWSSKATDIARICGLSQIARVERAIAYTLTTAAPLDPARQAAAAAKLHDRMTQAVFNHPDDLARLFRREQPRPKTT